MVGADIIFFKLGVGGQDDIGKDGIIFQPGMLYQHKFNLGIAHRPLEGVTVVPAGSEAGRIRPEHMDFGLTRQRIDIVFKLVIDRVHLVRAAVNIVLAAFDDIVQYRLRND